MTTKSLSTPIFLASTGFYHSLALKLFLFYFLIAAARFIPARQMDLPAAWAYIILHAAFAIWITLWLVRHPMYLGSLCLFLGLPLLPGSRWAYLPAGLLALTFIYRSLREDRYLHEYLDGYVDFATRTRYRLIPGVW